MRFLKQLWNTFLSLFAKKETVKVEAPEASTPLPQQPEEKPAPTPDQGSNETAWVHKALELSSAFEGSDPWANITGNFDGAVLTCGALGWTFKWYNQQPLVKKFVDREGLVVLFACMPKTGKEYWRAVEAVESEGCRIVKPWSNGSYNVKEPYKAELRALWKHPTMQQIQTEEAAKTMGKFASSQMQKTEAFLNEDASFFWYAMWFDQAVQNGTGKLVDFNDSKEISVDKVLSWCASASGSGDDDTHKNAKLWKSMSDRLARKDVQFLLKMGYLRARTSASKYQTDVMNRRGTIVMGHGYVHGKLFSFDWKDQKV